MKFKSSTNLWEFVKRHFMTLAPFLTVRKAFNALVAVIEMKLHRIKCSSRPFVYRIDPCSLCNLRCASCNTYLTKTKEKRVMDLADFKKIISRIKKFALRASLYDMGEPLLNKDIYKMIGHASDNHISTLISTNFNFFKEEALKALFDSRLTVLEPCLDGFTQEKYATYRRGGNVETVKNNIASVMAYKRKIHAKYPFVDVQVVEFKHIKDEIPLIKNFLEENKVDRVTFRPEVLGFDDSGKNSKKSQLKNNPCFWLYVGMMIRPDGSAYPCCGRDFDRLAYGNILKESLDEIWNNKYYQFSRQLFKPGPDLELTPDMKDIPCLTCSQFVKRRGVCSSK